MAQERGRLSLQLQGELDAAELDELTGKLRRQILELDVDSVERAATGEPPPGARAVDAAALGMLIVSLAKSPKILAALVTTVQNWLSGQRSRSVKIEMDGDTIELTGLSSSDQRRLIDSWVGRHANA